MGNTAAYEQGRHSFLSSLYSFNLALPGLLAMLMIAIFSNNLPGVPNPFTLANLFMWIDGVVGPLSHQPITKILNSNFVWNPFLVGLLVANLYGVPDSWKRGLSYIHLLMPLGIIMLAPHFMLFRAARIETLAIVIITASMFITAALVLYVARWFKLDDRHGAILAGGLSSGDPHVCAILMPQIKAKGGQVINALICVLVFGLAAMLILPVLGKWLDLPQRYMGLVSAAGIGNGHQALYAAFAYGYEAGRYAIWYDIGRHVIMPASFLFVFIVMFVRKLKYRNDPEVRATRGIKKFPLWLGVFIFFWILASLHVFKAPAHEAIFNMVQWDFSLAAAALGLSLSFRDISNPGWKGIGVAFVAGGIRISLLLGAVVVCIKAGLLPV